MQELLDAAELMNEFEPIDCSKLIDFDDRALFERNTITYLSGYVAKIALKKSSCSDCTKLFIKPLEEMISDNEIYTECREYAHIDNSLSEIAYLTRPSVAFIKIVNCQLHAFYEHHKSLYHQRKLLVYLTDEVEKFTATMFPDWFNKNNSCYKHRIDALKILLVIKIFRTTRERNDKRKIVSQTKISTNSQKLKNLNNL